MRQYYKRYYDIVIIPPEPIFSYAIRVSETIAKRFGSVLTLGRIRFKPHVSLYHVAVKPKDVTEMIHRLTRIAATQRVGTLRVGFLKKFGEGGSYQLPVTRPQWLHNLHHRVVDQLNPLRDRTFPDSWHSPLFKTCAMYQKNIKHYGSPIVGAIYSPHISLGALDHPADIDRAIASVRHITRSFIFTPKEIAVCRIGPHHSVHGVIARIPLS